ESHNYFRIATEQLLQQQTGAHGTLAHFQRGTRLVFSTETTEKLIQVMNNAHLLGPLTEGRFELLGLERLERLEQSSCNWFQWFHSSQPFHSYFIPSC